MRANVLVFNCATLVTVSMALVFHTPAHHASVKLLPVIHATYGITSVPNVTCRPNLLWSVLLYSIAYVYPIMLQLPIVPSTKLCGNLTATD